MPQNTANHTTRLHNFLLHTKSKKPSWRTRNSIRFWPTTGQLHTFTIALFLFYKKVSPFSRRGEQLIRELCLYFQRGHSWHGKNYNEIIFAIAYQSKWHLSEFIFSIKWFTVCSYHMLHISSTISTANVFKGANLHIKR